MDRIAESLKNNRFVFWEEIARDGAQAKTILNGTQRSEIAKQHGNFFGSNGPDHLVFAAGFISIGNDEVKAIRTLAEQVDNCYLAVNCRSSKKEILESLKAISEAKYSRIAYVLPISENMCNLMLHKSQKEVLQEGIEIAKFAVDNANGIPVDVQLAASFDADPVFIANAAAQLKSNGIAITHLGDTRGKLYPKEVARYIDKMLSHSNKDHLYGVHFHNDLGFALQNNLECISRGINLSASSWLGLAERNGLVATELLSFHLAYETNEILNRLGFSGEKLFLTPPDLKMLNKIAKMVSDYTRIELKVTDPIVGKGVNSISTGTPFVDTKSFQPFDPEEVLGVDKSILVTQLASTRLIKEVSSKMGFEFSEPQIHKILDFVKSKAYEINRSVFPENELVIIFERFKNNK